MSNPTYYGILEFTVDAGGTANPAQDYRVDFPQGTYRVRIKATCTDWDDCPRVPVGPSLATASAAGTGFVIVANDPSEDHATHDHSYAAPEIVLNSGQPLFIAGTNAYVPPTPTNDPVVTVMWEREGDGNRQDAGNAAVTILP